MVKWDSGSGWKRSSDSELDPFLSFFSESKSESSSSESEAICISVFVWVTWNVWTNRRKPSFISESRGPRRNPCMNAFRSRLGLSAWTRRDLFSWFVFEDSAAFVPLSCSAVPWALCLNFRKIPFSFSRYFNPYLSDGQNSLGFI